MIDWTRIETEYVAGEMSMKALAKAKRVSYSTLSKRASEGGWAEKRKNFRAGVANDALARAQARGKERMNKLLEAGEKLLDAAVQAIEDDKQFRRFITSDGVGEGCSETTEQIFEKYDTKAMKDMTAVLRDLTGMLRDAYGIRTPAQELGEKLAREKISQTKAQAGKARAETERVRMEIQREKEERGAGNEVTVVLRNGEDEFFE